MSDLQTAFYIIGIIFMSLALILTIVIAIAVLIIKKKITALHDALESKLHTASSITNKGAAVIDALKKISSIFQK